jgi:hypothetical protein
VDVPGFDVKELIIVGAPTLVDDDYLLCVDRNLAKSWEDVMKMGRPLRYAAQRPGIGRMPMGAEFLQLIGGPVKVIYGYKSTAEELAAFARGETEVVTCIVRRLPRMYPELIERKRLVPLVWWNAPPSDDWVGRLGGEKPLHILDLPGVKMTDSQKLAFSTAVNIHQFLRAFMLPPKTPMAAFARGETEVVTCLERRLPRLYPELIEKKRLLPIFWWNAPPSEGWLKRLEAEVPRNILKLPGLKISESQK